MKSAKQKRTAVFMLMLACLAIGLAPARAHAQDTSLSAPISDQLSTESVTDGFDSSFDAESSSLTNPFLRTDISDPTNAQLLGSSISPLDAGVYVPGSGFIAPDTTVLTDAQQAVSQFDPYFGGRQSKAFAVGGALNFRAERNSRQSGAGSFSAGSEQASFADGTSGRAAFSAQTATQTSATAFSGEGAAVDDGLSLSLPAPEASLAATSPTFAGGAAIAADPALLVAEAVNPSAGDAPDADGALAQPSAQVGQFFATSDAMPAESQFDDGQTPLLRSAALPGRVLPTLVQYGPAPGGFSDSTKGLAGSPSADAGLLSPLDRRLVGTADSPFPPISDGEVFSHTDTLSPNLHASPQEKVRVPISVVKQRLRMAQQKRVLSGMPLSDAEQVYQKELLDYERYGSQGRSRLPDLSGHGDQTSQAPSSMPHSSMSQGSAY